MKTRQIFGIYVVAALLAVGAAIRAQEPGTPGERQAAASQEEQQRERQLKEKHLVELYAARTVAVAFLNPLEHSMADTQIKGAPFSAQVVIENTQTLANGVHINSKSSGMLYRDNDGRTRSEEPREGAPEIVFINDPIARVAYHLHMFQQTAVKVKFESSEPKREVEDLKAAMERKLTAQARVRGDHSEHENELRLTVTEGQLKEDRQLGRERKVESLGTQTVEGVQAVGTRLTFTFAAGTEGNDQPFEIVTEKWYSPDLQIVIMTRHSDPRSGDNVYRLTNINRSEPLHSLFEPPSNFALKEEKVEFRER